MKIKLILLTVMAILFGEFALVILTTLVQEYLFSGVNWKDSSTFLFILMGLASFLAAVISGYIAWKIVAKKNRIPHIVISLLIAMETTWLISTQKTSEPDWLAALAGLSLIIGIWVGTHSVFSQFYRPS